MQLINIRFVVLLLIVHNGKATLHECGEFNPFDIDDLTLSGGESADFFNATIQKDTLRLQKVQEVFENVKITMKSLFSFASLKSGKESKDRTKLIKFVVRLIEQNSIQFRIHFVT